MMSPSEVSLAILKDYREKGKPVYFGAVPYVQALRYMDSWDENYFEDSAKDLAAYLLNNLSTWRGDTAKNVKNELRIVLGRKVVK